MRIQCEWYWGPIAWEAAELVLTRHPVGSFLMRDSASDRYVFTISIHTHDGVKHCRVPQHRGAYSSHPIVIPYYSPKVRSHSATLSRSYRLRTSSALYINCYVTKRTVDWMYLCTGSVRAHNYRQHTDGTVANTCKTQSTCRKCIRCHAIDSCRH
jgi:hypothetical protein